VFFWGFFGWFFWVGFYCQPWDKVTNEPKGVTYIKFSKTSEAALAMEEMNGRCIGSHPRPLKVDIRPLPPSPRGGLFRLGNGNQCCGSGSGGSVMNWHPGSGSVNSVKWISIRIEKKNFYGTYSIIFNDYYGTGTYLTTYYFS